MEDISPEIPRLLKQFLTSDEAQLQILNLYGSFTTIIKPTDWLLMAFLFLTVVVLLQSKKGDDKFLAIPNFARYALLLLALCLFILSYLSVSSYKQDNFNLLKQFLDTNDIAWYQDRIIYDGQDKINTILITKDSSVDLKEVLRMASSGKHIIIDANLLQDADFLGVQLEKQESVPITQKKLTKLFLENEKYPAFFSFNSDNGLFDSQNVAYTWANSDDSTHMLQIPYEFGLITVLSDTEIWNNHKIHTYDNAWLAWYLFQDSILTIFTAKPSELIKLEPYRYFFVLFSLFLIMVFHLSKKNILIKDKDKQTAYTQALNGVLQVKSTIAQDLTLNVKKDNFIDKSNQLLELWIGR
jgi:hypothetical protein